MERGEKERESQKWRERGGRITLPQRNGRSWKSSSLVAGLIPRSQIKKALLSRFPLVPRASSLEEIPVLCTPVREIMHANIVKIRFRVRSRPQDSAKERRKDK